MRPQLFQAFIPFHAAQMGVPPAFSGHFNQQPSPAFSNGNQFGFPFSFVFPSNLPGVSPFGEGSDIIMEDVADLMDIDPPEFYTFYASTFSHQMDIDSEIHSSGALPFCQPMDVDLPFYPKDDPMDIDTPPAVLELSSMLDELSLFDEPDSTVDVDLDLDPHPLSHPDDMALVLYNASAHALVLYNSDDHALVLYDPDCKAMVLYNGHDKVVVLPGAGTEGSIDSPQETDLPVVVDECDLDELIERFRCLAINDDFDTLEPTLPSSSIPTVDVPATGDAEICIPTSGSFHLFSDLERPFDNSRFTYLSVVEDYSPLVDWTGVSAAASKPEIWDYVVEEPIEPSVSETVYETSSLESPTTALDDITITLIETPDSSYPGRDKTSSVGSPTTALGDITNTATAADITVIEVSDPSYPGLDNIIPLASPAILTDEDAPRIPRRFYSEIYTATSPSRSLRTRRTHPYRRTRSNKTPNPFEMLIAMSYRNSQRVASAVQTEPPEAPATTIIIETDSDPVMPGAYPNEELDKLEASYLARPPFATFSPRHWRGFSSWILELLYGW